MQLELDELKGKNANLNKKNEETISNLKILIVLQKKLKNLLIILKLETNARCFSTIEP